MNYADIKTIDIQDGEGVRVSIYVSGCHFHCKGCHNKEAWDFDYGQKFDNSTIDYIIELMNHEYIAGLSILGGEPLELVNQQGLVDLVERVKKEFPNKTIWCYTGYDFDKDVLGKMYKEYDYTKRLLNNIDIMVDGEFEENKKLINLKFRGSTNQRKIDVKESLKLGKTVQLKFGDEGRYENKVILFKEYLKDSENIENGSPVLVRETENNNVIPVHINEKTPEKVVAESIGPKVMGNL